MGTRTRCNSVHAAPWFLNLWVVLLQSTGKKNNVPRGRNCLCQQQIAELQLTSLSAGSAAGGRGRWMDAHGQEEEEEGRS